MDKQTEHYLVRIARVFEEHPHIAGDCTEVIEKVGFVVDKGWGDVFIDIKEHAIQTFDYTESKQGTKKRRII